MKEKRRVTMRALACCLVGIAALLCGGCQSKWEATFTPEAGPAAPLETGAPVQLREVPWERLEVALSELEAERAASDAPPEEWPPEKKAAAKAELLRALQVTTDPARVRILGRSAFRTTSRSEPNKDEMIAFARKVGADTVVWSSSYLGKVQVVRDEPVSEWRTGSVYGRRRSRTYTETSTIWVPVVVEADEHAFMAYYLLHEGVAE